MHFEGSVTASPHETRASLSTPAAVLEFDDHRPVHAVAGGHLANRAHVRAEMSLVRISPGPDYRPDDAVLAPEPFRQPLARVFVFVFVFVSSSPSFPRRSAEERQRWRCQRRRHDQPH